MVVRCTVDSAPRIVHIAPHEQVCVLETCSTLVLFVDVCSNRLYSGRVRLQVQDLRASHIPTVSFDMKMAAAMHFSFSERMLFALVLSGIAMVALAEVPAAKHVVSGTSALRPGFHPTNDLVRSSFADRIGNVEGKESIFGASRFGCPCSYQFWDGSRWRYCTCNICVCSCVCHN
ncbi:hypothetical protein KP509_22G067400 [Ceratopteris richardii]|uniref:Uncharacterized protein n=1 Tax=Ceratopteris richardii TaxID=49495 RepID=A0A8T2S8Y3_CERRI|nr:hypothetical protein KP509_22G067400 [Ceratopteris richardii]